MHRCDWNRAMSLDFEKYVSKGVIGDLCATSVKFSVATCSGRPPLPAPGGSWRWRDANLLVNITISQYGLHSNHESITWSRSFSTLHTYLQGLCNKFRGSGYRALTMRFPLVFVTGGWRGECVRISLGIVICHLPPGRWGQGAQFVYVILPRGRRQMAMPRLKTTHNPLRPPATKTGGKCIVTARLPDSRNLLYRPL